jgi:hypothetical protein
MRNQGLDWRFFRVGALLLLAPLQALAQDPAASADLSTVVAVPAAITQDIGRPRLRGCWDEHPCIRWGDIVVVSGTAVVQVDDWRSDVAFSDTEEILKRDVARRRVGFTVRVHDGIEIRMERELADTAQPWRDRYVNLRPFEALQLRAGTFMLPFSRDENTPADRLGFMFHSQSATLLAPGRDRGWLLHGTLANRQVGYEFGVFDHDGQNARASAAGRVAGDRTVAGRATGRPWTPSPGWRGDLRASVAFTSSEIPEGTPTLGARTVLDVPYYSSNVYVNGHQRRFGIDVDWRAERCRASVDYARAWDERLGESVEDTDLSPFYGDGWLVGGMCTVLGRPVPRTAPSRQTLMPSAGAGVLEVGARLEWMRFGTTAAGDEPSTSSRADVIPGNGSDIVTVAVNWHLNRWVVLQANLVRETLTHPDRGPFPEQPRFWSQLFRLQFRV